MAGRRRRDGGDLVGGRVTQCGPSSSAARLPSPRPLNVFAENPDDLLGEGLIGVSTSLSFLSLINPHKVGHGQKQQCSVAERSSSWSWAGFNAGRRARRGYDGGGGGPALFSSLSLALGFKRPGRRSQSEAAVVDGDGGESGWRSNGHFINQWLCHSMSSGGRSRGGEGGLAVVDAALSRCFKHVGRQSAPTSNDYSRDPLSQLSRIVRDVVDRALAHCHPSRFYTPPSPSPSPCFASISSSMTAAFPRALGSAGEGEKVDGGGVCANHVFDLAMTLDQVCKRLEGVPVYTVTNASNEFVLISGSDETNSKSLGLFCFSQDDAEALLAQVKDREPGLGKGARVVAVSLDKVYQLNAEGIAFRFLPESLQVMNALELKAKAGDPGKDFDGVPVFQSDNLIVRSNSKRYCPLFLCKEDLDSALRKAIKAQQQINPIMKNVSTEVQVGSLEDVLKRMEDHDEGSGWGDIILIPPGVDVSTYLSRSISAKEGKSASSGSGSISSGGRATVVA